MLLDERDVHHSMDKLTVVVANSFLALLGESPRLALMQLLHYVLYFRLRSIQRILHVCTDLTDEFLETCPKIQMLHKPFFVKITC